MEKINKILKSKKHLSLDSCIFIYHFEGKDGYLKKTFEIFNSIEQGKNTAICSTLIFSEILTLPFRLNKIKEAKEYEFLINTFPNLKLISLDSEISVLSAKIRAKYDITTPDSIHIATALQQKIDLFITNDFKLKKIDSLEIVCLDEL